MIKLDQLTQWTGKRMQQPGADQVVKVDFVHLSPLQMVPATVLNSWEPPPADIAETVREVYEESINHAEAAQGAQRYAFRLFRQSNPRRPSAQYVWMIDADDGSIELGAAAPETPDARGIASLALRMAGDTRAAMKDVYTTQKDLIKQLRERVTELESERAELWQAAEGIFQHKHERELDHTRMMASEARKAEALQAFKTLVPVIASRAAKHLGLKIESPDVQMLDQVFASLNEQQFTTILTTLTATQQAALLEFLKRRDAAQTEKSAEKKGESDGGPAPTTAH